MLYRNQRNFYYQIEACLLATHTVMFLDLGSQAFGTTDSMKQKVYNRY